MSNQIVISSGAKVRELEGVLTGTSGIVNALGINVPSGIPQLDGSGKILVSQLPNSVMEYKGSWNAATNTPTLVNGTGNAGDVYLCEVAGTVNFGAGPITFAVGDQVIYSGSIWQRASGATGTVTSVAVTESGDALTITGSPITTSGTINIGFAGTSGQYINGAGGLTTFPSLTGFVPYTGATGNVDLGTYDLIAGGISSSGIIVANGLLGALGGLDFQKGNIPSSFTLGDVILYAEASSNNIVFRDNTSKAKLVFNNSDQTYTFPAITGTLALLEGTQTFSGSKTFSTGIISEDGLKIKFGSASNLTAGYLTLSAYTEISPSKTILRIGTDASQLTLFRLQNTNSFTYEFPAASGTIALTSNLSSYVPYTGATANVNLGTFDLTADVITGATGSFASSGGSDTFAINHSSGSGIALNITKGGNGEGLYINKTSGSGNALTVIGSTSLGALSGTSATFSGNGFFGGATVFAGLNGGISVNGSSSSGINFRTGDTLRGYIYTASSNMYLESISGSVIIAPSGNPALTLASTGAATFSGSVTANGILTVNEDGAGTKVITVRSNWAGVDPAINVTTNNPLLLMTNNSEKMRITSAGNVGIGTSSPNSVLEVAGTSSLSDFRISRTVSSSTYFFIKAPGGSPSASQLGVNGTDVMTLNASGNVGIGTSSPNVNGLSTALTINGSSTSGLEINANGVNQGYLIASTSLMILNARTNIPLLFYTNDTERMRITSGGNVLIGTTTDSGYKLDVTGTVRSTGGFFDTSDSRLKILVKDYEQPKGIENVAARMYVKNSKKELGYYAQDLQEILPSAVNEGEDGFLSLSYSQVHTAKIAYLEDKVAQLEELIKKLL